MDKNISFQRGNYNKGRYKFNRQLLPTPAAYYTQQFAKLRIRSEWVKVRCCFHEDKVPSLSINMVQGHFKCHACGARGGNILSFHRQRYQLSFIEAARALGAWEANDE